MLYASEVEQKSRELRMTAGYEHKFQWCIKLLDQLDKLLFGQVMGAAFVGLKDQAVRAMHGVFIGHTVS